MNSLESHTIDTPEQRLLDVVKRRGSASNTDIATDLGVSAEAVRQRVNRLEHLGLIKAISSTGHVGRPRRNWRLTSKGDARYPDRHSQLSVQLLDAALQLHGVEGVAQLLDAREHDIENRYLEQLADCQSIEEKLYRLAALRDAEGYMARVESIQEGEVWLLIEDHCPIHTAAERCQAFCSSELHVFRSVLGDDVEITREEHLQNNARRCAYRIALRSH